MQQARITNILPYKLGTTNDQLTSRAGLLSIAQLMRTLKLSERLDKSFLAPKSNHGFKPSQFIQTLILMQHEGSFHLDDVRHLEEESTLMPLLGIKKLPKAGSRGAWLKRMGKQSSISSAWEAVNKVVLKSALHKVKDVTLDIDATEIIATNQENLTNDVIIHWYNQRAEDSENRIKELTLAFGGDTLPCSDFEANNVYFLISALSYNLFALMRQLLPIELAQHRVTTIRWRVYAIAAKIVKTGRQLWIKLNSHHQLLLKSVLEALRRFEPPPI